MTPRPLNPDERSQYSYEMGKGLYSALQLKKKILESNQGEPESDADEITIKIPKKHLEQVKKSNYLLDSIVPSVIAGTKGFNDEARDYKKKKIDQYKKMLDQANNDYIQALQKKSTPCLDAFCVGMLSEIEKQADDHDSISDHALMRSLGNIFGTVAHPVTKHLPSPSSVFNSAVTEPIVTGSLLMNILGKKKKQQDQQIPDNVRVELE